MTDPRVLMMKLIHESNLIEDIDDRTHDRQGLVCWLELCRYKRINHLIILECHRALTIWQEMPDRYRGQYRDCQVTIGDRLGCEPGLIKARMDNWIDDMVNWRKKDPKQMHIIFENIHPFFDGSGRVGRLLMWWHQRLRGIQPVPILAENKGTYYEWWK